MLSYLRPMENVRCQFNSHVPFCLELVHFIYFGLLRHFWPPHNLIAFVGDHKICKSLREQWWLLQVLHHSVHPQHLRNCSQQTYPGRLSLDKCYMSRFLKEYIWLWYLTGGADQRQGKEKLQARGEEGPVHGVQVHGVQFKFEFQWCALCPDLLNLGHLHGVKVNGVQFKFEFKWCALHTVQIL